MAASSLQSLEQARGEIIAALRPLAPIAAPLSACLGAILREDARTTGDLPAFDRSAMDGYAIAAGDASPVFRVIGQIRPGETPEVAIHPGECVRIFTGAALPEGASQVLKQEDVTVAGDTITPIAPVSEDFVRRRGEDARAGERLIPAGTRLGPGEIALLASLGIASPLVSPPIRIVHFATGDELTDHSDPTPGPFCIRDSNSPLIRAFAATRGGIIAHHERFSDNPDLPAARAATLLDSCVDSCDMLLISGGASVGDYDFGREVLLRLGFEPRFTGLDLRPGKPLAFATHATRQNLAAFVLPGNPLAHIVLLHCVLSAAFDQLRGADSTLPIAHARLLASIRPGGGRHTLWPAHIAFDEEGPVVQPLRFRSSGDLTGMAGINAFIRCHAPVLDTGARVACILAHA